jgi:DNA-binding protein H-NS
MENNDLKSMATYELLELYEKVGAKLAREMAVEKARLQERLRKIESASNVMTLDRRRRRYPKAFPRYRNPKNPAETWSGRGKQPRWMTAQLRTGKEVKDFLIARPSAPKRTG